LTNEFCTWFTTRVESKLFERVEILQYPRSRSDMEQDLEYFIEDGDNTQLVIVKYLGIVNPKNVVIDPFSEDRLERARTWVSDLTMGRVFVAQQGTSLIVRKIGIPQLYRHYKFNAKPGKYQVTDGQHRTAVAIEKGVRRMIAYIVDTIQFNKDDVFRILQPDIRK